MLNLTYKAKLDDLLKSPNLAGSIGADDLQTIGLWCKSGYDADKQSRAGWESRMGEAMKLALQVREAKTFPWPNASNVKFPLLTVSALNFHARAYPSLVPSSGAVKCGPVGYAPPQELIDRCARVAGHMSYQVQRCTNWEAETDKSLLVVPIMGCAFKKVYYNATRRQRRCDLVMPQNLVVHYYASDLESAFRYGEYFEYTKNEVAEEVLGGQWRENKDQQASVPATGPLEAAKDKASGMVPPAQEVDGTIFRFVEAYVWIDLDGDGYDEPYIVTFDHDTGFVRRIVARFLPSGVKKSASGRVVSITPVKIHQKIPFIPSPDGGFYDLGLGTLLGPLNHAVDSLINLLINTGVMSSLGGGFLGRGARIKRGSTVFTPGEWKQVDSSGSDLSGNVVPLPVKEPSKALFDLMVYLVGYAERIASANEVQSGEVPDWNMKAEVMKIADQNGARIYAAIFKRMWRAEGEVFKMFYLLNRNYPIELDYEANGRWFQVSQADYEGGRYEVLPAADPNAVTDSAQREQADLLMKLGSSVPGFNVAAVTKRVLRSRNVPDIQEVFPVDQVPEPPNIELLKLELKGKEVQIKEAQFMAQAMDARARLQMELEKTQAEILNLYAQAAEHAANAESEETYAAVAALNTKIASMKDQRDGLLGLLDIFKDHILPSKKETDSGTGDAAGGGGPASGGAGAVLPTLVAGAAGTQVPGLPPSPEVGNAD